MSERVERTFAHTMETGRGRRSWIRGVVEVGKRHLMQVAALNLGTVLRKLIGVGTPRELAARSAAFLALLWACVGSILGIAHRRATTFLETSGSGCAGRGGRGRAGLASCAA